jgi:hypothetical protein
MRFLSAKILLLTFPVSLLGCGSDEEEEKEEPTCSVLAQTGCDTGLVCEEVPGGKPACFSPISITGKVFDTQTDGAIEGAHVVARDANEVAVSGIAVTDKDGLYSLRVPAPRGSDGKPVKTEYTLRADANGYLTFPKAPRVALPVDISAATGDPPSVGSTATEIGLIPLPDTANLGTVSGTVLAGHPGGTLVVAGTGTATAGVDGEYTVFNVPAGSVEVRGYLSGVNLESVTAEVKAGETTPDVDLDVIGDATATVSGTVQIVNPGDGKLTSVILVVEDTFVENAARGEAPPGLRAGDVSGSWSVAAVPDGKYVVLGAFENDFLVRDPDTSIGGTEIQHITVGGGNVDVPGFKITGALAVLAPDGGVDVSGTPTFQWEDDSSEDTYDLVVFDALGNLTWEQTGIVGPGGNAPVEVSYEGPALLAGMYYQFRATSIKDGVPISRTEDLKGVFVFR